MKRVAYAPVRSLALRLSLALVFALAATVVKPQARVLAEARGLGWVEVDSTVTAPTPSVGTSVTATFATVRSSPAATCGCGTRRAPSTTPTACT